MGKRGVAVGGAENEIGKEIPPATAAYSYVRIRKIPPYSKEEMALLRSKIRDISKQAEDIYFYIKHDDAGLAPLVAFQLQKLDQS